MYNSYRGIRSGLPNVSAPCAPPAQPIPAYNPEIHAEYDLNDELIADALTHISFIKSALIRFRIEPREPSLFSSIFITSTYKELLVQNRTDLIENGITRLKDFFNFIRDQFMIIESTRSLMPNNSFFKVEIEVRKEFDPYSGKEIKKRPDEFITIRAQIGVTDEIRNNRSYNANKRSCQIL